jgi:glutamate carboxypeptidase
VHPELIAAKARHADFLELLREMAAIETPSRHAAGIEWLASFLDEYCRGLAEVERFPTPLGPNLLLHFAVPAKRKRGRWLGLAHSDTVHEQGSLLRMPLEERKGFFYGPGVLDIKGGIALFIMAMRMLQDEKRTIERPVALLIGADEEIGSHHSRQLIVREAKRSHAVLVMEPGTGAQGHLKTARKGVGEFRLRVQGVASHAGVDFAAGASAIVEASRQVERIAGFNNAKAGVTLNPGIISGGTRTNVVAEQAEVRFDVRTPKLRHAEQLARRFTTLRAFDRRCTLQGEWNLNRPPMERTSAIAALARTAITHARELGVELRESSTGGGSDGNFTAAAGVPTLDGLGCVGSGAHTPEERIDLSRVADRMALLRRLLA